MEIGKVMLSELINLPIYYEDVKIGKVRKIIFNPDNGNIEAYALDKRATRYIPRGDIRSFLNLFFVVDELNPVFERGDIIKIDKLLDAGVNFENQKVYMFKTNEYIGRLIDIEIDTMYSRISSLIVKKFLGPERTLSIYDVVNVTADKIFIDILDMQMLKRNLLLEKARPALDPALYSSEYFSKLD